jgi:hypothetical protein
MSTFVVAAYVVSKAFGGHEEGGWWYNTGELVRTLRVFKSEDKAYAYAGRLNATLWAEHQTFGPNVGKHKPSSILSEGEWISAEVHENAALAFYPDTRPHYE